MYRARATMTVHRCFLSFTLIFVSISPLRLRAESEPPFDVMVSKNVMIPMRDGVHLATDIYRPAKDGQPVDGKFPTILERTPYNKDGGVPDSSGHIPALPSEYFVPRGYAVVLQDVRGRYKSEGHWQAIKRDPDDGFDTAKWIGSQPWSTGKIGTMGTSY